MREGGSGPPRVLVDSMLEKLGAYLRILGLDAAAGPGAGTRELAARADREDRVLLTRSTRIPAQHRPPRRWHRIESTDPVLQLREAVRALGVDPRARLFTRCIRCNVELELLGGAADLGPLAERVPARVRARHDRFWRCPSCDTVFWRGTHVANTLQKLGLDA